MWNIGLILRILLPFEASQVLHIPLIDVAADDKLMWAGSSNEIFSNSSAYQCIREWKKQEVEVVSSTTPNLVWKCLYKKLHILPRRGHFMWRVHRNIVPTRKRLWKRGVACPIFCPRCEGVEETLIMHWGTFLGLPRCGLHLFWGFLGAETRIRVS